MNFRLTTTLLISIFVIGLILLGLAIWDTEDKPAADVLVEELVNNAVKTEQVSEVIIERGDSPRMRFVRIAKDRWDMAEPVATRAEASSVDAIIAALFRAKPIPFGELSASKAVHGLDPPSLRVTLKKGEEISSTVNVGDVLAGSKAVAFVTTSARPARPMAVSRSDLEALFKQSRAGSAGDLAKGPNDYRTKQVFAVDSRSGGDNITDIKLTNKGKDLALMKSSAGIWQFTSPAGWGDAATTGELSPTAPSAITGVRSLINSIVNLQATSSDDFIDHVDAGKLKDYGLNPDNPDVIRVELKEKDGATEIAFLGKKSDAAPPAAPGTPLPPAPPAKYYATIQGSNTVVHFNPPATMDGLYTVIANPDPLRDRELVKDSDKSRIDAIDITVGGQLTKLRRTGGTFGKWQLFGGPNDPQDANSETIRKLLDLVAAPRAVKDFPPSSDANFTPAETRAEIKLWPEGIKPSTDPKADPKAEPKVEGPPIVLQFGKKDAEGLWVRRTQTTGAKNDCRLPDKVKVSSSSPPPPSFGQPPPPAPPAEEIDVLTAVARTRLDFLDPSLKSFSPFMANKLTIQNGANLTEIVKEKSMDTASFAEPKWKYVKPDPFKDRPADGGAANELLGTLSTTHAVVKFISEAPSDADLVKWGLDPKAPRLKVTVGIDTGPPPITGDKEKEKDKDSQRVYYLGNETDDKQNVYARQEGKSAVFTLPKLVADKFASADLRDRTIARIDRAKVKKVTLSGFKDKSGFVVDLVFDKKDGSWVVSKSPPGYMVDPAKVDKFLDSFRELRAKAFVPGTPKPEQKLGPPEGGLQITLDLDGAPSVTFFVGAATDMEASAFLQTSTLPAGDNIVTVAADVFKAYKDNSGAFAK